MSPRLFKQDGNRPYTKIYQYSVQKVRNVRLVMVAIITLCRIS